MSRIDVPITNTVSPPPSVAPLRRGAAVSQQSSTSLSLHPRQQPKQDDQTTTSTQQQPPSLLHSPTYHNHVTTHRPSSTPASTPPTTISTSSALASTTPPQQEQQHTNNKHPLSEGEELVDRHLSSATSSQDGDDGPSYPLPPTTPIYRQDGTRPPTANTSRDRSPPPHRHHDDEHVQQLPNQCPTVQQQLPSARRQPHVLRFRGLSHSVSSVSPTPSSVIHSVPPPPPSLPSSVVFPPIPTQYDHCIVSGEDKDGREVASTVHDDGDDDLNHNNIENSSSSFDEDDVSSGEDGSDSMYSSHPHAVTSSELVSRYTYEDAMRHHPLLEETVKGTIHNMAALGGGGGGGGNGVDRCLPASSSINISTTSTNTTTSMAANVSTTLTTSQTRLQLQKQQLRSASSVKLVDTKIEQLARLWNTAHAQFSPRRTTCTSTSNHHQETPSSSRASASSSTPQPNQPSGAMIALCVFIDECLKQRHRKLRTRQQQQSKRGVSGGSVGGVGSSKFNRSVSSRRGVSEASEGMEPLPSPAPQPTVLVATHKHYSHSPTGRHTLTDVPRVENGVDMQEAHVSASSSPFHHDPVTKPLPPAPHTPSPPDNNGSHKLPQSPNNNTNPHEGLGSIVACRRLRDAPGRVVGRRGTDGGSGPHHSPKQQQKLSQPTVATMISQSEVEASHPVQPGTEVPQRVFNVPTSTTRQNDHSEGVVDVDPAPPLPDPNGVAVSPITYKGMDSDVFSGGLSQPPQVAVSTPLYEHLRPPNLRPSPNNHHPYHHPSNSNNTTANVSPIKAVAVMSTGDEEEGEEGAASTIKSGSSTTTASMSPTACCNGNGDQHHHGDQQVDYEMEVGGPSLHRHPSPVGPRLVSRRASPSPREHQQQTSIHYDDPTYQSTTITNNNNSLVPTPRQSVELVEDPHCGFKEGGKVAAVTTRSSEPQQMSSSPRTTSRSPPQPPLARAVASSSSPVKEEGSVLSGGGGSNNRVVSGGSVVVAPSTSLREVLSGGGDIAVRRRRQPGVNDDGGTARQQHTNAHHRRSTSPQSTNNSSTMGRPSLELRQHQQPTYSSTPSLVLSTTVPLVTPTPNLRPHANY